MPREARIVLPGVPHHIIQRSQSGLRCFSGDQDYQIYLSWLEEYLERAQCHIHAYVLMPDHVHLLVTPERLWSMGELMRRTGQRYAQYYNRKYQRSGALWEGRYRSCIACEPGYILNCYRYIEMNPVRKGFCSDPGEYAWTSYRCNALGEQTTMLQPDDAYDSLGDSPDERREAYRSIFSQQPLASAERELRRTTSANRAYGSAILCSNLEQRMGKRVALGKPGRPRRLQSA